MAVITVKTTWIEMLCTKNLVLYRVLQMLAHAWLTSWHEVLQMHLWVYRIRVVKHASSHQNYVKHTRIIFTTWGYIKHYVSDWCSSLNEQHMVKLRFTNLVTHYSTLLGQTSDSPYLHNEKKILIRRSSLGDAHKQP